MAQQTAARRIGERWVRRDHPKVGQVRCQRVTLDGVEPVQPLPDAVLIIGLQDGRWRVDALPWVAVTATGRREALDEARAAVVEWREVGPDTFEVEAS